MKIYLGFFFGWGFARFELVQPFKRAITGYQIFWTKVWGGSLDFRDTFEFKVDMDGGIVNKD